MAGLGSATGIEPPEVRLRFFTTRRHHPREFAHRWPSIPARALRVCATCAGGPRLTGV